MKIDEEMRLEVKRLESELKIISKEIQKLEGKIVNLINIKKKYEHNLQILKSNFEETTIEEKEIQRTIGLIKR